MIHPSDPMQEIERRILSRVCSGPCWSQSIRGFKPVVDRMVAGGLLRRSCAPGSKVPLLIELTVKGEEHLARIAGSAGL